MSDFKIIDLASDKRIDADDGEEVTIYVRPGGIKSAIVQRQSNFSDGDAGVVQWVARWENGAPIAAAFTEVQRSSETQLVGGGPAVETIPSACALMIDLTIPPDFIGVNRCSVFCHVGATTMKAVTVKFVILPFDKWLDISWLPQGLVDIVWELHSDRAWSEGLAERWIYLPNAQTNAVALRAGMDVPFAIIPMIAGVPVIGVGDVTTLSFALRLASDYDADPLLALNPAVTLVDAGGGNKYYTLTATMGGDAIVSAFKDLNAQTPIDAEHPVDYSKLAVIGQFTLTTGGITYVSRAIPFYLEQPAGTLA